MTVVMLASSGDSTWMIANALSKEIPIRAIILEESVGGWVRAKSRARKLGWINAIGQVLFVLYSRMLTAASRSRIQELTAKHGLNAARPTEIEVLNVRSVNEPETVELLQALEPNVIVVNGTRILSTQLLASVNAIFLNMHAGITPKYRGVHGGYWALASGDAVNAGVTVHLIDAGIDTGGILYQARIQPGQEDNFVTYPVLQIAAGLPLLIRGVRDALTGQLELRDAQLPSRIHYHPTLWRYLWLRLTRGIR
jgi:phosphoribosylglycinamide formyltransferase 1